MSATRQSLLWWAQRIGPSVGIVVEAIFNTKGVDGFRPVRALLSFEKRYGRARLNAACKRALLYDTPTYQSVKSILVKHLDSLDPDTPVESTGQQQFRFARQSGFFDPDISPYKELSHG